MRQTTVQFPSENAVRVGVLQRQQEGNIQRLVELEAQRNADVRQLAGQQGNAPSEIKAILAQGVAGADAKIAALRQTIAETRQQIAELQASAQPAPAPASTIVVPPQPTTFGMPSGEFEAAVGLVLFFPLVVALAVRIVRRGSRSNTVSTGVDQMRFARLEQAVEAVAIEIERIGEAQRFAAKLLAERQADEVATRK